MKKLFLALLFLSAGLFLLGAQPSGEKPEWMYFGSSPGTDEHFFYDTKSVRRISGGSLSVTIRKEVKNKDRVIKSRQSQKLPVKGYENLSEIQAVWDLDCAGSRLSTISETHLDAKGNLLDKRTFDKRDWAPISPNSLGAHLQEMICPKAQK